MKKSIELLNNIVTKTNYSKSFLLLMLLEKLLKDIVTQK